MKQTEMSGYLKFITLSIGLLFLLTVLWFVPSVFRQTIQKEAGETAWWGASIFIWITAVPCFISLWKFWGICCRIGKDQSFTMTNARALKQMSHCFLADSCMYVLLLGTICIFGWYAYGIGYVFGSVLILFVCISLTVLCAVLSHLVYKASRMQEEQELTI